MMEELKPQIPVTTQTVTPAQPLIGMNVPKIYANGFIVGVTLSDLNVLLVINGQPSHQLIMSLISAKTLMNVLKSTIDAIEEKTKIHIPDMNEMKELINPQKTK